MKLPLHRPAAVALAVLGLAAAAELSAAAPGAAPVSNDHYRYPRTWPFRPPDGLRLGLRRGALPDFWADGQRCSVGCRPHGARAGWPLRPFHRQHPLRAGLNELRKSSLHHGIDIQCEDHQHVYAMQSGRAHIVERSGAEERVQVGSYIYWHVNLRVHEGQHVRAYSTVLGTTKGGFGHLHLSEVAGGRYLNPLRPGGRVLSPWREHAAPVLDRPRILSDGRALVRAFDPQTFRQRIRYETPVLAPAAVAYRVVDTHGHAVTGLHWAYRGSQNLDWSVHRRIFASDSRAPTFWCWVRHDVCRPRWDFVLAGGLAPSLRSLGLHGRYVLRAYAWDWAGNTSSIGVRFRAHGRSVRSAGGRGGRPRLARVRQSDSG